MSIAAAAAKTIAAAVVTAAAVSRKTKKKSAYALAPRLGDWLVVALCAAGVVLCARFVYGERSGSLAVVIESGGRQWRYSADGEYQARIPGALGDSIISVDSGRARIIFSPCPNRTCVQAGYIDSAGEWLACLPNRVLVRIEGAAAREPEDSESIDIVSY